jgi:hypothetical protein
MSGALYLLLPNACMTLCIHFVGVKVPDKLFLKFEWVGLFNNTLSTRLLSFDIRLFVLCLVTVKKYRTCSLIIPPLCCRTRGASVRRQGSPFVLQRAPL